MQGVVLRPGRSFQVANVRPSSRGAPADEPVAVVIPCYKVTGQILDVLRGIGDEADLIYVVDDKCPEGSGALVQRESRDPRVRVLFHDVNQGVGGATITGIRQALADGAKIIVKIDGDGQMDASLLPVFVEALRSGEADYAKGNRFFDPDGLTAMPTVRLLGNAALSFLAKLSTGYWHSFDPTNGYIAIHADVARLLPLHKVSKRYFFETDLLFRLNTHQARVVDVPMPAQYGDEASNLRVGRVILPFLAGHLRNFGKRILYNYFLRDFNIASLEFVAGLMLLAFGLSFGIAHWSSNVGATAGTVMLAALPIILGVQFLLAFIAYDVQSAPSSALHVRLAGHDRADRRYKGTGRR
jgi:dolichol-phosphate mannosyltransferase